MEVGDVRVCRGQTIYGDENNEIVFYVLEPPCGYTMGCAVSLAGRAEYGPGRKFAFCSDSAIGRSKLIV